LKKNQIYSIAKGCWLSDQALYYLVDIWIDHGQLQLTLIVPDNAISSDFSMDSDNFNSKPGIGDGGEVGVDAVLCRGDQFLVSN